MQDLPKRRVQLGATGEQVRGNVRRLRERLGLSQAQLARQTANTSRPLASTAINEIENGARRVDVDDLLALAVALGVNPNALLMPDRVGDDFDVEMSGAGMVNSSRAWRWARGHSPISDDEPDPGESPSLPSDIASFRMRIEPRVLPPRLVVTNERQQWINDQTVQLALDLKTATAPTDAREIRRQIEALSRLDPDDDAQWSAFNEQI
jgi:transcriptional regulator with XRE-family HTH domain